MNNNRVILMYTPIKDSDIEFYNNGTRIGVPESDSIQTFDLDRPGLPDNIEVIDGIHIRDVICDIYQMKYIINHTYVKKCIVYIYSLDEFKLLQELDHDNIEATIINDLVGLTEDMCTKKSINYRYYHINNITTFIILTKYTKLITINTLHHNKLKYLVYAENATRMDVTCVDPIDEICEILLAAKNLEYVTFYILDPIDKILETLKLTTIPSIYIANYVSLDITNLLENTYLRKLTIAKWNITYSDDSLKNNKTLLEFECININKAQTTMCVDLVEKVIENNMCRSQRKIKSANY